MLCAGSYDCNIRRLSVRLRGANQACMHAQEMYDLGFTRFLRYPVDRLVFFIFKAV